MIFLKGLATLYIIFLAVYLLLRFTLGDAFWWLSLLNTFAFLWFIPLPLAMIIVVLQKAHWIRWLSLGISLVSLLWFGSYFVPQPQPKVTGQSITLVSYNMQTKPEGLETLLRNKHIDLVFLQEIPLEYEQFANPLNDLYPYQFSRPQKWENAVLSSYPILKAETLPGFESNRFQRLEIDLNGTPIAIYNVHPVWPIGNPRVNIHFLPGFILKAISGFDDRQRNAQIDLLIQHLKKETLPFIAVGDFNMSQYSAQYQHLARVAKDSFREAEIGFGNTWPATMQSGLNLPPLLRLDYVWHSQHFQSLRVERQSKLRGDHFPLLAQVVLIDF
jgi:endonuclease/exonuclease/phosphatase (EEP) superfamily protein YafD